MPPPPIRIGMRPLLRPQAILRVTRTPPTASRLGLLAGWTSFATHSRYRSLHLGPGSGSGSGVHNLRTSPHPRTTTNTTNIHLHRLLSLQLQTRAFHPSRRRHDVFFFAVPAVKSTLLNITRISLLFLPFVFRYKLWKKYRRTSLFLIQIPIFAFCIVLALGLDQSPRTGRWRLLLMSENEEHAWSSRRHKDILHHDGPLILPPDDPRSIKVGRVTERMITAIEEQEGTVVHGTAWAGHHEEPGSPGAPGEPVDLHERYQPSAIAHSAAICHQFESRNPFKRRNIKNTDWNVYVIESPQINAFCLPNKEVFVYTGLLDLLPDDDHLLAAVIGHEVAHVLQRHGVENMGFLNVASVIFDVLRGFSYAFTISFPFVTDMAGTAINWINDVVAERAYSRKLEEEADAVGLDLMAWAGYDPRSMLDLWELMSCVEADAAASGRPVSIGHKYNFLRTHPATVERQKRITEQLPRAMRVYWQRRPEVLKKLRAQRAAEAEQQAIAREKAKSKAKAGGDAEATAQSAADSDAAPSTNTPSVPVADAPVTSEVTADLRLV